jgi:hypothetical protein
VDRLHGLPKAPKIALTALPVSLAQVPPRSLKDATSNQMSTRQDPQPHAPRSALVTIPPNLRPHQAPVLPQFTHINRVMAAQQVKLAAVEVKLHALLQVTATSSETLTPHAPQLHLVTFQKTVILIK